MIKELIVDRSCDIVLMCMMPIDHPENIADTKFGLIPKKVSELASFGDRFYLQYEQTADGNFPKFLICLDLFYPELKTVEDIHKILFHQPHYQY